MALILKSLVARSPDEPHRTATQLELFFDLVSVIAIAAVTASFHHAASAGHGVEMLPNFIFLFVAVWWAWMNFTWFASAFDNDDALFRILTIIIMGGALIFASGVEHIFETLDFGYGLIGWIVMRVGMILLWLRAAAAGPEFKTVALKYAIGIAVAQCLWIALYFLIDDGNLLFLAAGAAIFLVEFSVPVIAERAQNTPWHRHHIIERFGLLNIIVLGEVLLSLSLIIGHLYGGALDLDLVITALSGLVLVFVIWWIYFIENDHLNSTALERAVLWGYGHVFIFASGAMLGAGLGIYLDVLTNHSSVDVETASLYINLPVAVYLTTLWVIRDQFFDIGLRRFVLIGAGILFVGLGIAGTAPWVSALVAVAVLIARFPIGRAVATSSSR